MCFLTVLEVVKSKIKLSAGLVSPASSVLGLQVATFLLGPHLVFWVLMWPLFYGCAFLLTLCVLISFYKDTSRLDQDPP